MARFQKGIVVYNDEKLIQLLRTLEPGSSAYNFFVKDAMRKAIATTKPVVVQQALIMGYPNAPGIRMTRGAKKSRPYKVWGRIPRAVRAGRFVLKRKDGGDTSQRVIIGSKFRGSSPGAPHGNITRYSKNTERFTKKGYSRGRFAAKPFVGRAVSLSRNVIIQSFERSYIKFAKQARKKA